MELGTFIEQICRYDRQEYFECYGQIEERLHNLEKIWERWRKRSAA